jgi:hypothetical protein
MQIYQQGLLRKATALSEAVKRGLIEYALIMSLKLYFQRNFGLRYEHRASDTVDIVIFCRKENIESIKLSRLHEEKYLILWFCTVIYNFRIYRF